MNDVSPSEKKVNEASSFLNEENAMNETSHDKIKVRKINFGHEKIQKKYWYNDNPISTHFLNALHAVFPDGEKLFIRSVKYFEKNIQDPALRERVKGFIGQEVQHGLQHQRFYESLKAQGVDIDGFVAWYKDAAYEKYVEPAFLSLLGNGKLAEMGSLSVTAALEHYTATLAEVVLKNPNTFLKNVPEDMKHMLMWHAAEEIEHKAVAYDVYVEQCENNYPMRMLGLFVSTVAFFGFITCGTGYFILQDEDWKWEDVPKHAIDAIPRFGNLAWNFLLGMFPYLDPNFHPNQVENTQLAKDFFDSKKEYFERKTA